MAVEKVAKVKVGLYEPIRDGMLVNLFLESIPDLQLRLDANRSWTLEKALSLLSMFLLNIVSVSLSLKSHVKPQN